MKQFKLLSLLFIALYITSCTDVGEASIEKDIVVDKVEKTYESRGCADCLQDTYKYKVKLKTHSGDVYYYTNYKHEVGDTLLSIFEFTDSRDGIIKTTENKVDSLIDINSKLAKKNDELELYNTLLMGIIQDGAKKNTGN